MGHEDTLDAYFCIHDLVEIREIPAPSVRRLADDSLMEVQLNSRKAPDYFLRAFV